MKNRSVDSGDALTLTDSTRLESLFPSYILGTFIIKRRTIPIELSRLIVNL